MWFRPVFALAACALVILVVGALRAQEGAADAETAAPDEPAAAGAAFAVEGIPLDVKADTVLEARDAAFREAPRQAWPRLWSRLTGRDVDDAPILGDAALDAMIDSIEVETERFGNGRYIARLGVIFDRVRAGRRLPPGARVLQSQPLLLVPILTDAGATSTLDPDTGWFQAWQDFSSGSSVIDYVRPQGTAGDRILLGGWTARRDDRAAWRLALARYEANNVLTAEARLDRSYPGGPILATFAARHGPAGVELERFTMRAEGPADLPTLFADAVKRMDAIYARALQDGTLQADEALSLALAPIAAPAPEIDDGSGAPRTLIANVLTPDPVSWGGIAERLDQVPIIDRIVLESFALGGTSEVGIVYRGSYEALRLALDQRGLRLEPGEAGLRLRPRSAGEAPLAAPDDQDGDGTGSASARPSNRAPIPISTPDAPDSAPPAGASAREDTPRSLLPGGGG
ncbi:MAG: hypothetical protein AAGD40_01835 [Pseudomonadota bacterium]